MAAVFQKNRKQYLDEEQKLTALLCNKSFQESFQSWLDGTVTQIESQLDACEQKLSDLQQSVAVDEGLYWTPKTLMQHCNLNIDVRRLVKKDMPIADHASWPDLIRLIAAMNALKSKGLISPAQVKFLEKAEAELNKVFFYPTEVRNITNALATKLNDETQTQTIFAELTKYQNAIDELAPDLDSCEQMLEAALVSGDMAIAEDISYRQLDMFEHMLKLTTDQYPIINQRYAEAEEARRRRRWSIFRMANKDITCVVEAKFRQIEACEDDLGRIKEQLENYCTDDLHQRRRYELDKEDSNKFLQENKEKQQAVWGRIAELFDELVTCQQHLETLAQGRKKEIDRRLRLEEREAGRRSGHSAFVREATKHAALLQDTIDNAVAAKDIAITLNDFVLDRCDTVTSRFDRQQTVLSEQLKLVQNNHFKRFSDFYLACARLLYRKERKMNLINEGIDDSKVKLELASESFDPIAKKYSDTIKESTAAKRSYAEEIVALRHRLEMAERQIAPTLRAFEFNKVHFVHPRDIATKVNTDRAERVLDFREVIYPPLSRSEVMLREEEALLNQTRQEYESRKKTPRKPKPPTQSSLTTTASGKQYQRYQAILDKPLESPVPMHKPETVKEPSASPALPTVLDGCTVRALYRYVGQASDELSFEKNDKIICVGRGMEEGWYLGVCNQKSGLFPVNYVTVVENE